MVEDPEERKQRTHSQIPGRIPPLQAVATPTRETVMPQYKTRFQGSVIVEA